MTTITTPNWIANPAMKGREESYVTLTIDLTAAIKSWRSSLYAFEWLDADGNVKPCEELSADLADKRRAVEAALAEDAALEQPVLGISLMDNVEIGAGKAVLLTLAAHGHKTAQAHIPKSQRDEFGAFVV
jgi:hypothetical protein